MRKAFTLIELLVVIAIIAILAAILFPVFTQAKNSAKKTQSISNMKQIGLAAQMYSGDSDEVFFPLYTYDPADMSDPTNLGFRYFGVLLQPYAKSTKILLCPNDTFDDPTLADPQGRGRFDPANRYKSYISGANTSYGLNFRYLNTFVQTGPTPQQGYWQGQPTTSLGNTAYTLMFAEATMKDKTVPGLAPGVPTQVVKNPVGYSRIDPPFGAPPSRPGWNAYTLPDARAQGSLWPRFSKDTVIVAWADGHVKPRAVKSLIGTGTTVEEVDRFWNGMGQ